MATKTRKLPEKKDVGALVFLFAQADGQFGIVSTDRKIEQWGRTLDDCWPRYFTKATRAMRKAEKENAAKTVPPVMVDPVVEPDAGFEEV